MKTPRCLFALLSVALMIFLGACSLNSSALRTESVEKPDLAGTYTVILYGANSYVDIATVAILVPEGGRYTFEMYAPDFNYRTVKGVPANDALIMARRFVSWHPDFRRSVISRILDGSGAAIGYEVRPLYLQTTFGRQDVMHVDYFQQGDKIVVHVHLDYEIERQFMGGGRDRDD